MLKNQSNIFRRIIARLLRHSRCCYLFKIDMGTHLLKFSPTALSAALWVNPKSRMVDYTILSAILKPNNIYIDVGANIGSLALHAARLVGDQGCVIAIEPNRQVMNGLNDNVSLNNFGNIITVCCGCGGETGVASLRTAGGNDDQGYLQVGSATSKVRVQRLDDIINPINSNIRLLKIDVEGHEELVINGATRVLDSADFVLFEYFETNYLRGGSSIERIIQKMDLAGFDVYTCKYGMFTKMNLGPSSGEGIQDLLAVKRGVNLPTISTKSDSW
jgi:FkbM family methyltransferase